jgi:hypothetical protein
VRYHVTATYYHKSNYYLLATLAPLRVGGVGGGDTNSTVMSDTYQSRVFTFVSRRTNQLKDNCAKGLRHLKVAVIWSGQILLYPLHLLAQTVKNLQPQLPPPRQQAALPQPVSDINIEQALDLVEVAGYPILLDTGSANEIAPTAAVTTEDRWFTDESLWDTGYGNIAIKDRQITDNPRASRQVANRKPTIRGLSSRIIDRQLVLVTTENEILDLLTIAQQQEIRRRIGIDLALAWQQWHTNQLSSKNFPDRIAESTQLFLTSETTLERELPPPNLFDRLREWLGNKPKSSPQNPPIELEFTPPNEPKSIDRLPPARYSFNPQPPQIDRWLELPQLPPIREPEPSVDRDNSLREMAVKLQPEWFKQLWNYYRDYVYIPDPIGGDLVHQSTEFELTPIDSKPSKIVWKQPHETRIQSIDNSAKSSIQIDRDLADSPDWIETESELLGYSKSPIARFLAWLDRIVLSIENWLIKIWHKLTNLTSSN